MRRRDLLIKIGCLLVFALITIIAFAAFPEYAAANETPEYLQKTKNSGDGLITVFNPLGQPLDSELFSLAPRFDTLDGKTIYIVDVKYPATTVFRNELTNALKEKYPNTNWISREKTGSYFEDDPELWSEIKAEGAGMIIFIGH